MKQTTLHQNDFATISQQSLASDIDILTIVHQNCQAKVSLYGGQVLSWQPSGQQEVFWLSKTSLFQQGKAIRGGIPLCWPWFGPYQDAGNHGFARQLNWQLTHCELKEQHVVVQLTLAGEQQHPLWQAPYKLVQTLTFGQTFSQQLTMHNLSDKTVQYSGALHSYFAVSSPENTQVNKLNGISFDDKITGKNNQQDTLANCVGPIDRIYDCNEPQQIIDNRWQRKITISSAHCHQWVLWNPGAEIASTMADIHQGGEEEYLCLEAANTRWQEIPAYGQVSIGQHIAISQLSDAN